MKFKKERDETERLERAAKIQAHLTKGTVTVEPSTATDRPSAAKVETTAQPQASLTRIYPPLQAWEKVGAFGRRYQYRPQTRIELDQENDRLFMESQQRQDAAHSKKVLAAEQEAQAEQKETRKRAEHEARTGRRAYGQERYIGLEEARSRGLLNSGGDNSHSGKPESEWWSPGNPGGLLGGGR